MTLAFDIWKLLAGVAIFLLGMFFLEEALAQLGGRSFKLFLKKHTSNRFKAILGGAVVTAVLQSSSVVNLMVLAFTGAGIIKMRQAIAVILGANLGTTVSSWIIATAGFQFNIESFALPVIAVGGVMMVFSDKESRWYHWSRFLFGFGFLFLGLGFIRTGMEEAVRGADLGALMQQPAILFILAGLVMTTLVQSSSATVAIVLSALHANAITLFAGMAVVLGSEVGTTIKLILASVKGIAVKKRVALGNFLINCVTVTLFGLLLVPINLFITETVGMKDPLLSLVFFQSLINLAGIAIFYPVLGNFGRFLEKRFTSDENETLFIHKIKTSETELALTALEKETQHLLYHVSGLALSAFDKKLILHDALRFNREFESKSVIGKYDFIKQLHGDIHLFSIRLQGFVKSGEVSARIAQLIASSRNAMYAAKNIKDAWPDTEQLKKSSNDLKYEYYRRSGDRVAQVCGSAVSLLAGQAGPDDLAALTAIYRQAQAGYRHNLEEIYQQGRMQSLSEIEFSTIVNFNREIFTFEKSVVFALKDYLLTPEQANQFDELPGFIR